MSSFPPHPDQVGDSVFSGKGHSCTNEQKRSIRLISSLHSQSFVSLLSLSLPVFMSHQVPDLSPPLHVRIRSWPLFLQNIKIATYPASWLPIRPSVPPLLNTLSCLPSPSRWGANSSESYSRISTISLLPASSLSLSHILATSWTFHALLCSPYFIHMVLSHSDSVPFLHLHSMYISSEINFLRQAAFSNWPPPSALHFPMGWIRKGKRFQINCLTSPIKEPDKEE